MKLERLLELQGNDYMVEYVLFELDAKTNKINRFAHLDTTFEKARSEAIKYLSPAHRRVSILQGISHKGTVTDDIPGKSGYFFVGGKGEIKEIGLDGKFIAKKNAPVFRITNDVAGRNVLSTHKTLPLARATACKHLLSIRKDNYALYIDAGENGKFYASITYKKDKFGFGKLMYEDNKSPNFRELNDNGTFKRK